MRPTIDIQPNAASKTWTMIARNVRGLPDGEEHPLPLLHTCHTAVVVEFVRSLPVAAGARIIVNPA